MSNYETLSSSGQNYKFLILKMFISFPFDGAGWLGTDIVDHAVNTVNFVDNTVGKGG